MTNNMLKKVTPLFVAGLRLGASLGNLGLIYILSNFYGIAHVGAVSLVIAAGLGVSTVAKFGYDILAIKYLPSYIANEDLGSAKSFILYFSIRIFLGISILLLLYFYFTGSEIDFISMGVLTFSFSGMSVISSIIKSSLRAILSSFFELGYAFLSAGIVLFFLGLAKVPIDITQAQRVVALTVFIYFSIALLFSSLFYRGIVNARAVKIKWGQMNMDSINFMLISVVGYSYSYGYVWLVGELFDLHTVAFIAVVARVVFAVNFSMMIANTIFNPKFAIACASEKKEDIEMLAAASLKMMLLFSFIPFLFIVLFPSYILSFFNVTGSTAAICLVIMALAQMINVITGNAASILNLSGAEKIVRNNAVMHFLIATILGFVASSYAGVIGLVAAYAIGIASQNILLTYLLRSRYNINIYKGFLRG